MALNPRAEHIYEIASIWLNECLFNDGSLFWPNRKVWTSDNLDSFWRAFAENLDEGEGSFVEKWAQQLSGQNDDVHRMAVEVAAIYCLFPRDQQMGPKSKRKLVGDVLAFSGDLGEMDHERWGLFEQAVDGIGIGMTGAGYLAARPFHIGMYLGFAKTVKKSSASSIEGLDPTSILDEAFELVSGTMNYQPISTKHILLHILWPEKFEDYASAQYKKNMAKNLSAHFGLTELADIDATILQARKYMEANGFEHNFSMHEDHVEPLWKPDAKPKNINPKEEISGKFELAQLFKERVLENNTSFLWPDDKNVWTPENAKTALEAIKHLAGQGQKQSDSQIVEVLRDQERSVFQIICDVRAANVLKSILNGGLARGHLEILHDVDSPFDGDEQIIEALVDASSDKFPGSIQGGGGEPTINHMLIILAGLQSILSAPESIGDRDAMVDRLFNHSVKIENDGIMYFPFWTLLFLMYPEQVPPTPAWSSRERLRRKYRYLTQGIDYPNYMAEMADVRAKLDPNFDPFTFDFFADPWVSMGKDDLKSDGGSTEEEEVIGNGEAKLPPTLTDLARATHLEESRLREIEALLNDKQQLIFEGPPGSGKTFVAEKVARYFTGQPLTASNPDPAADESVSGNDQIEIVQFHQSYSYEDFVEGIRPDTNENGQLVYKTVPGIFRVFANKAKANPNRKFVLIIDEINRGNVSRILGELMLLLEYRDKSATLPYSKEQLTIPPNLYIIGTMNSADRSLSQIDYALRRRFYFVRFMSVEEGEAKVLKSWLHTNSDNADGNSRSVDMFVHLNRKLSNRLGTDDLQVGHSYFMRTDIHDPSAQEMVWKYAVMPLLREYLYHDRERDEVLKSFTLEEIRAELAPPTPAMEQPEIVGEPEPES